ncbi:hypothetical protein NDU88_000030 [Pleurodeles waltl]|uniref:Uncharacterized protein n=1 Tax=Pleurodeles waltl TaxID=8319 RepID=A0AAV7NG17_PLEWA|nr:hypothetical protein NDU88_000030 [Pleurodeles waltl]
MRLHGPGRGRPQPPRDTGGNPRVQGKVMKARKGNTRAAPASEAALKERHARGTRGNGHWVTPPGYSLTSINSAGSTGRVTGGRGGSTERRLPITEAAVPLPGHRLRLLPLSSALCCLRPQLPGSASARAHNVVLLQLLPLLQMLRPPSLPQ